MNKIKFKVNDEVMVIAGKDKGKTGQIEKILRSENKVIVKGVNIVKKHNKPSHQNQDGSISEKEAPIHVSNVAYLVKKATKDKPAQISKIGYKIDDKGKKVRIAKRTQKEI
ncbi:50S ribosomal protein L24 [Mycoplasma sp. 2045]|uniref:50S ribosomal protein L24 n=1 Tax=unclassified Mycoplasma TaxID=2683645 RepID=UPI00211CCA00|nr:MULTISPECIES: 50S ribosomal protein L24 [unclassified Mycoplasma]MEA4134551.1 50S ribosomal protein L24 [Mycoplasma sp. 2704]MEA4162774.1 50S ribosomal protein L24 [Mycoplasma sp. 4404]MEA4190948.1 50S ribosomal protein L24 [Mycoplasma sp. 2248]MEA4206346.1 50S ribosomal protein L24 [Mycoplasma sp. 1199]MEA4276505.1 50S ribosomal protein L24 [Mycoplasma sp. 21DD0573]